MCMDNLFVTPVMVREDGSVKALSVEEGMGYCSLLGVGGFEVASLDEDIHLNPRFPRFVSRDDLRSEVEGCEPGFGRVFINSDNFDVVLFESKEELEEYNVPRFLYSLSFCDEDDIVLPDIEGSSFLMDDLVEDLLDMGSVEKYLKRYINSCLGERVLRGNLLSFRDGSFVVDGDVRCEIRSGNNGSILKGEPYLGFPTAMVDGEWIRFRPSERDMERIAVSVASENGLVDEGGDDYVDMDGNTYSLCYFDEVKRLFRRDDYDIDEEGISTIERTRDEMDRTPRLAEGLSEDISSVMVGDVYRFRIRGGVNPDDIDYMSEEKLIAKIL